MKLSEDTINLLKNFSAINPNMVFKAGNTINTISEAKNILATAKIAESFDQTFGIYDLNVFLAALSLVESPELTLGESSITIRDGVTSIEYFYSSPSALTSPAKMATMPQADVVLNLSADVINKIKRAAAVFGHTTVSITGAGGRVSISAVDPKNPTANKYSILLDEVNARRESFTFVISIGNLKMLPGDYTVEISSKLISHFKNNSAPVEYFIALDKTSTFAG